MSADNAVFYREIDDKWWVMYGFASCEYKDSDFRERGDCFETRESALIHAHAVADTYDVLEYGVCRY
jgi:hypothetical protein